MREFVNAADVLMRYFPGNAQLVLETLHDRPVLDDLGLEHLQRDAFGSLPIRGFVHDAHCAAPDFLKDIVSIVVAHAIHSILRGHDSIPADNSTVLRRGKAVKIRYCPATVS